MSENSRNSEDIVKDWLVDSLGVESDDPVLERVWKLLKADDQIADVVLAIDFEDEEWATYEQERLFAIASHLVKYAESVKRFETGLSEKDILSRKTSSKVSFASEHVRCRALGEYIALQFSRHPLIRKFRNEVLDGKPLSPSAARQFVSSPAASRMKLDRFKQLGIPVVDHVAFFHEHGTIFKEKRWGHFIHFEFIYVDPPGKTFRTHLPVSVAYEDLPYLHFPRPSLVFRAKSAFDESRVGTYPVYPGSVLDDLRNLSIRMTEVSNEWTQAEVAWFVLTGEPISVSAITAEYVERSGIQDLGFTIRMTIEPWMSTEKVAKVYEYMRYRMLAKKPRAAKNRNVEIFRFTIKRRRERLTFRGDLSKDVSLPIGQLMGEWNEQNPGTLYYNESTFKRDLGRGAKGVLSLSDNPSDLNDFFAFPLPGSTVVK